jgi:hypothetical protein
MTVQYDEYFQQLNDHAELTIHLRQQHQKRYCGECKKEFKTMEELIDNEVILGRARKSK